MRGSGESAGAGDPCLGGDRGRQRLVFFGSGSSSTAGDAARGGSASADFGESRGTCERPAGRLPTNRVRDAPKSGWPKRAKRTATLTSREFQAARTVWTEQAPTPNEDGGMPYRMTAGSVVASDA